jgi:hypothetical protein
VSAEHTCTCPTCGRVHRPKAPPVTPATLRLLRFQLGAAMGLRKRRKTIARALPHPYFAQLLGVSLRSLMYYSRGTLPIPPLVGRRAKRLQALLAEAKPREGEEPDAAEPRRVALAARLEKRLARPVPRRRADLPATPPTP